MMHNSLFEMYFNEDEEVTCAEICLFASNKGKTKSCWNMFTTKIVLLYNTKKKFQFNIKDILSPKIYLRKHLVLKCVFSRCFECYREHHFKTRTQELLISLYRRLIHEQKLFMYLSLHSTQHELHCYSIGSSEFRLAINVIRKRNQQIK
jgi:hypothetical protein